MKRLIAALAASLVLAMLLVSPATAADFGLKELGFSFDEENGSPATLSGSHPFGATTRFELNTNPDAEFGEVPAGALKDFFLELPPGMVGDPYAVEQCSNADFADIQYEVELPSCSVDSAVGAASLRIGFMGPEFRAAPVWNLEPTAGYAAKLGFIALNLPVTIDIGVNPRSPSNLQVRVTNVSQAVRFYGSGLTVWGNPASPVHDPYRGACLGVSLTPGGDFTSDGICESDSPERPFLTLPRSCPAVPLVSEGKADSWQAPGAFTPPLQAETPPAEDCAALEFKPTIASQPTDTVAESPTGLEFNLDVDDPELTEVGKRADSDIERAVVTLPEGVTTNPSIASGLGACALAQYESENAASTPGSGCPNSAKIGSVEVETPLLEKKVLQGSIYVARQGDNPFGNLLTIYMVIKDPVMGIVIRQAGKVDPDPLTGRLTTTFDGLPQLPFSHFRLRFRSGQRAPLITPPTCGTYTTEVALYPYADPGAEPLRRTDAFAVTTAPGGGRCAPTAAQLPNAFGFSAGTVDSRAGAYSPFVLRLDREDGSQRLSAITTTLPRGLLGKLAGVPYCSDAQIAVAASRTAQGQGALELAQSSCPDASQVGTVNVGVGAGDQPYHVSSKAYLAGPYKGAPLSLEIITPALAGPFDLGVVAVRTALSVDPMTAQITATSDPLPSILHGLPLDVRSVAIDMSRQSFTLNPTSCEPKSIDGSALSALGQTAPLSQYFQASDCGALGFKPKLALSLKGSTRRTKNPALKAVLTYPTKGSYANIAKVTTVLPRSQFIDNRHINNPCTRVQFSAGAGNGAACPKTSILGKATAYSPLLDKPLSGPIYFRSNGGDRDLPDLVASLDGQIHVNLVGFVDSVHQKGSEVSRTRTTFAQVPDAPVSKFVLELKGGKKGLLQNSVNLCKVENIAHVKMVSQNARVTKTRRPLIATACGKKTKRRGDG